MHVHIHYVCDPQVISWFGCVDHDLIREYKHGVHNAPVICPLNPTTVCTSEDVL